MFGFFNIKSHFQANRQVYFFAVLIVFLGFFTGAFYSNMVSDADFGNYGNMLEDWTTDAKNAERIDKFSVFSASDISNIMLIFFWSFFIFGKPLSGFFAFKSGFSLGFFISFFVKVYGFKGFVAGMYILFNYMIFTAPALIAVTARSIIMNMCICNAVFGKSGSFKERGIKKLFFPFLLVLGVSVLSVSLGNYIGCLITSEILQAIF